MCRGEAEGRRRRAGSPTARLPSGLFSAPLLATPGALTRARSVRRARRAAGPAGAARSRRGSAVAGRAPRQCQQHDVYHELHHSMS
eukprot:5548676-Alexandrium_andersonii.AAC.1